MLSSEALMQLEKGRKRPTATMAELIAIFCIMLRSIQQVLHSQGHLVNRGVLDYFNHTSTARARHCAT